MLAFVRPQTLDIFDIFNANRQVLTHTAAASNVSSILIWTEISSRTIISTFSPALVFVFCFAFMLLIMFTQIKLFTNVIQRQEVSRDV